jgi:hypothetical protein
LQQQDRLPAVEAGIQNHAPDREPACGHLVEQGLHLLVRLLALLDR